MGLWKEICKQVLHLMSKCSFLVGNGANISFWNDPWCSETPLHIIFLSLYENIRLKKAMVVDLWENGNWEFNFGRRFINRTSRHI